MDNPHRILLLLSLIFLTHSSSFTYTFPYNAADPQFNPNYYPAYHLGAHSLNYSLNIRITVTNTANSQLPSLVSALALKFVDSTNNNILLDAVNSDGNPFTFPSAFDTTYQATYAISFPNTYPLPSAAFILFLADNSIQSSLILDYYSLEVTSFPTAQGISVSNANAVSTVLKVTEVMRDNIVKMIYVSQSNQFYTFTAFPASYLDYSTGLPIPEDVYQVSIYSVNVPSLQTEGLRSNHLSLSPIVTLTSNERYESIAANKQVIYIGNIAHYSYQFLQPGFYLLEFEIQPPMAFTGSITFNSDPYACPFSIDFPDYYFNFQPCTTSPFSNSGELPCLGYDPITRLCAICARGYTLKDGQCWVNTTCPERQYYNYGQCYNVSQNCGDYDHFTGNCLTCRDTTIFSLKNGNCIEKPVVCGSRQWKLNRTCLNVSQTCKTFDFSNGSCLSCTSDLYQLNSNGTCTLIEIICLQGEYLSKNKCVPLPRECFAFDTTQQKCYTCIPGYLLKNGSCQAIVCPSRQILARNGVQCVSVSQLCGEYNPISGECLTCRQPNYSVRNGECVQVISALAGCKQRERLGFGPCVGADLNCQTFNLNSGNCQDCKTGYYLDYSGHCRINANCTAGYWTVNGECIKMPTNCLQVNNIGLCTRCSNKTFRIIQGQCIYFQICGNNQFLNQKGQCEYVSSTCATWNPSNGLCITCKTPGVSPNKGVCCPYGQIFFSSRCVDVVTLQNSKKMQDDGNCLVRHPSLNFCLQCLEGFKPTYSHPYDCVQDQ